MKMKHPFQGCECYVCSYFLKNGEDCYGHELLNSIDLQRNCEVVLDGGHSATVSYIGHKREYHGRKKADMEREIGVTVQIHELDNEEAFLPFMKVNKPFAPGDKRRASYPPFTPPSFSFDVDSREGSAIEANCRQSCHPYGVFDNGLVKMGDQFIGSELHRRHMLSKACHSPYQIDQNKCHSPHWTDSNPYRSPHLIDLNARRSPHSIDPNACRSPHSIDPNACRSPHSIDPNAYRSLHLIDLNSYRSPHLIDSNARRIPHCIDPNACRSPHWTDTNTCHSPHWMDRNSPRSCGGSHNSDSNDSAISTGSHHMHNYDHINLAKMHRRCSYPSM